MFPHEPQPQQHTTLADAKQTPGYGTPPSEVSRAKTGKKARRYAKQLAQSQYVDTGKSGENNQKGVGVTKIIFCLFPKITIFAEK